MPSVIAESSFGRTFPRFYIRGIGNTDFDLNSTQPVSLVYDDVPYENPILKGCPVFFDIAQVEVLRGPQGSLFGRNTPGGIIKFDSVKPGEKTNGYARIGYGRFNSVDVEGAFGAQLVDGLLFRASGLYQRRDDYVDNLATGEDDVLEGFEEFAGRVQVLAEPTSITSLLLNLHGRTTDGSARVFRANIIDQGERGLSENFDRGAAFLGAGNFGPGLIPFPSESAGNVDDLDQFTNEARTGNPENGNAVRAQNTDSIGIFGSLTYELTDQLTISGGLRWTKDEKEFAVERLTSPFGAGPLGPITAITDDDEISWDASATHAVNEDANLYARIARLSRAKYSGSPGLWRSGLGGRFRNSHLL